VPASECLGRRYKREEFSQSFLSAEQGVISRLGIMNHTDYISQSILDQNWGEKKDNSRQLFINAGLAPKSKSAAVLATVRLSSAIRIPITQILRAVSHQRFDLGIENCWNSTIRHGGAGELSGATCEKRKTLWDWKWLLTRCLPRNFHSTWTRHYRVVVVSASNNATWCQPSIDVENKSNATQQR
jgi:hypothetical protein